jgi:hypothetical protein
MQMGVAPGFRKKKKAEKREGLKGKTLPYWDAVASSFLASLTWSALLHKIPFRG